ncbi:hypothetical protein HYV85_03070 [Candidatus Woesearchaeota archaeon]|nr:hypothetical protein [Candidatus Woesearchaeota archaeon]
MRKNVSAKGGKGKRAAGDVVSLGAARLVLAVALILIVILPFFSDIIGLPFGGAKNAYAFDNGFARLVRCAEELAKPDSVPCDVSFTIDDNFYLVAFNMQETTTGKATKPPECNGIACFCVCPDDKCQKIDADKNRGRDCKPVVGYEYIVAQKDIKGNSGGKQIVSYTGEPEGRYFYVEGEKTIHVRLQKQDTNLYIGKQ